jgi:hypothetical protein
MPFQENTRKTQEDALLFLIFKINLFKTSPHLYKPYLVLGKSHNIKEK